MDDVIVKKVASIERCILRVKEEYDKAGVQFDHDYSRQDAAILNLQRACEQAIDIANYLVKKNKWGIPTSSRESFDFLLEHEIINKELNNNLKKMVGFRNLAIHEYNVLNIDILKSIIAHELDVFKKFGEILLRL
ncbi:MAG: DUF86 domain-containing protein [Cyclobacteriaceae bacterium]